MSEWRCLLFVVATTGERREEFVWMGRGRSDDGSDASDDEGGEGCKATSPPSVSVGPPACLGGEDGRGVRWVGWGNASTAVADEEEEEKEEEGVSTAPHIVAGPASGRCRRRRLALGHAGEVDRFRTRAAATLASPSLVAQLALADGVAPWKLRRGLLHAQGEGGSQAGPQGTVA